MKKLLATTLCLASVWVITFKAIPALYPGIDTLTDYQSIQINSIEDNNFKERIDNLQYIVEKHKANGQPYIIDSVQKLGEIGEGTTEVEGDSSSTPSNDTTTESNVPNEQPTEPVNNISDVASLTELSIDDVMLINVEADKITFMVNGQTFTNGLGVIGATDVEVAEIDLENKSATIKQGSETRLLVLGF